MADFNELPLVTPGPVWRCAAETDYVGTQTLNALIEAGEISPIRTRSGRVLLTVRDARKLYDALCVEPDGVAA